MKILKTKFKDLLIIKQKNHSDNRGSLRETFNKKLLNKRFVFEYCTTSKKNILRGFHFQKNFQQAKYVNVLKGKILDVVIDLRKKSKTFGKSFKIVLSKENATGLYIPRGFAHAYYSFYEENIIYYKLDNFYKPEYENGIKYDDKKINIKWPSNRVTVSKKDNKLNSFNFFCKTLKGL